MSSYMIIEILYIKETCIEHINNLQDTITKIYRKFARRVSDS